MEKPFYFFSYSGLIRVLGVTACTPAELLDGIKKVPASSIYYHTHKFLQQHHYLSPEPPNDFAYWLNNIIKIKELGEAFASVNIVNFRDLEELRSEFIRILQKFLHDSKYTIANHDNARFYFMSCVSFIFQTPYAAHDLREFTEILEKISINSLYFHVFEARLRHGKNDNDFSLWLKDRGDNRAAEKISALDPYTITLDHLRKRIVEIVHKYGSYK
ncbi:MAG: DUF5752 family protein [bacterium]|nr:DUF5752 family protein [bacterium]